MEKRKGHDGRLGRGEGHDQREDVRLLHLQRAHGRKKWGGGGLCVGCRSGLHITQKNRSNLFLCYCVVLCCAGGGG